MRDELLSLVYELIIQPKYRLPKNDNETLLDCRLEAVNYDIFKQTCWRIAEAKTINEFVLSSFIVSCTLHYIFSLSDTTDINNALANNREMLDVTRKMIETGKHELINPEEFVAFLENNIEQLPTNITEQYNLYEYYC